MTAQAAVTRFLPDGWVCSAYWYAWRGGMLTGPWEGDLEFLRELGWHAAVLARRYPGAAPGWQVPEGPYLVWLWPEWVWSFTTDQLAHYAAEYGDYCPDGPGGHGGSAWANPYG